MNKDAQLKCMIIQKMLRKRVIGKKNKQIDTVKGWMATHNKESRNPNRRNVNRS